MEEKPPVKKPETPAPKSGGKGCLKIFLAAAAVLFFLFLLLAGAVALAIAATGLVEVPVLSKIIKPPAVTEDFSYTKVSDKRLEEKLESLEGTEGKVTVALTDDEANTLISDLTAAPDSSVKEILLKFSPGLIKVLGTLTKNDAQFYGELRLVKSADNFEFEFQNVRLGALPLPGVLVEGLISQVLGTGELLGQIKTESLPVDSVAVKDGSITIEGLDLSGLLGPEE